MDKNLLDILVCPVSKAPLHYDAQAQELVCKTSNLPYPIRDGIPIMLEEEARPLNTAVGSGPGSGKPKRVS